MNRDKTFRNMFYNGIVTILNGAFPLIVLPIVTLKLSPESLGNIFYNESIAKYLSIFSLVGLPIHGIRELSKSVAFEQKKETFLQLFAINILFTVSTLIVYLIYIFFFSEWELQNYLVLSIFLANSFVFEWAMHGLEKFRIIAFRTLIIRLISLIFIINFVEDEKDSILFFFILTFSSALLSLTNLFYLKKYFNDILPSHVHFKLSLKIHGRKVLLIFFSIALISVYTQLDTILLGFFSSKESVAIYSIGQKVPKAAAMLLAAFTAVLIPRQSNYLNSEIELYKKTIDLSFRLTLIIGGILSIFLFNFSEMIIFYLASDEYSTSSLVLKWLSITPLVVGFSNLFGIQVLTINNKDRELLLALLFGSFVSLSSNVFLSSKYGAVGTSISVLITELTITFITFYMALKIFKFKINHYLNIIFLLVVLFFLIKIPIFYLNIGSTSIWNIFWFVGFAMLLFYNEFLKILRNEV